MRLALAVAVVALWFTAARADREINTLIGDASWAGHSAPGDEVTRIRAHLSFVHSLLASRDVSALSWAQRAARATSLANLARYIERGVFPRRTGDAFAGRRPRFIDDRGVHCAVGQLIADSGDEELAQSINARFEYAHVREMTEPALLAWASAHGFTVDELAMIQPGYSPLPTPDSVRQMIIGSKDAIALRCAQQHEPMGSLLVIAVNDKHGATYVRTKSTDPFAQCFVRYASGMNRGGGAYMGSPRAFSIGIDLSLPSPQRQLEDRIGKWGPNCMPRPGAIPSEAILDIASSKAGLVIEARTSPGNALVESCMKEEAKNAFNDFGPGAWKLHAVKKIKLYPHTAVGESDLQAYGRDAATECNPNPAPGTKTTITMTAKPDDRQFTVTATGSSDFSRCVSEALDKRYRDINRTSYMADGKRIEFFRIDANIKTTVTIEVESQTARTERLERQRQQLEMEMKRQQAGF